MQVRNNLQAIVIKLDSNLVPIVGKLNPVLNKWRNKWETYWESPTSLSPDNKNNEPPG